uniref:Mitochondrial import inner membrane translocase subunit Tim21 n=1 Tax=Schistosoma haematobium TaxID=6185 RepID=A0A095AMW5_SCHHA
MTYSAEEAGNCAHIIEQPLGRCTEFFERTCKCNRFNRLTVTPYLCQRLTPNFLVHKTSSYDSWHDDKGRLHMAMKFYIKGNLASGVVYLEVVENESKEFDYRYLIVETEGGFSKKQIILRSSSEVDNPNL